MRKLLNKFFHIIFSTADRKVSRYVRVISWLKERDQRFLGTIISRRLQRKYGVFLPYSTRFNSSLILKHPVGIVIGEGVIIGSNVVIYQNVTLGRAEKSIVSYPSIGDNTIIYSGAVVIGGISIGENCIVGANSVVTKDVPDNSVAVGVPAKILRKNDR